MINFQFRRFRAIFIKEFRHIIRDRFVLIFSFVLPFIVVLILGNSIEFNLSKINTAVVDHDQTAASLRLQEIVASSGYFKLQKSHSPSDAFGKILNEKAKLALIIAPHFGRDLESGKAAKIQVLVDGADNSSLAAIGNYLNSLKELAEAKLLFHGERQTNKLQIKERFLFNHELNSKWFSLPGLTAVIIGIIAILLTTLTICKEWEHGSMELLMSTPVQAAELILGKILPYAILSNIGFFIVYLSARLVFHVPLVGSNFLLFFATLLFILSYLGIGLLVSLTTKVQQVAVQKALIIGMLPTSLLSGFIFPVEYMPTVFRYLTVFFPPRWYVLIARNQFLQGSSISDLWLPFLLLTIQTILIVSYAITRYKRSLE